MKLSWSASTPRGVHSHDDGVSRACLGGRVRTRAFISAPVAVILALLPSCSQAQPERPDLSPKAEKLVDEAADLLFGSAEIVPPIVDYRNSEGGMGSLDPSCSSNAGSAEHRGVGGAPDLGESLNLKFSWFKYAGIICGTATVLDKNLNYKSPLIEKNYLQIVYNIVSDMDANPVVRRPVVQYEKGFFSNSGRYCQLWLRRNGAGQVNFAAVRILSKDPERYSANDHQQQECFVRGSLAALGLEGAAELPFETLAYRSPVPVGLHQSVVTGQMRQHTVDIALLIFQALPEKDFEPFTLKPIRRREFIAALANWPGIEKLASDLAVYEMLEQKERDAQFAPIIATDPPQAAPPR